MYKDSYHDKWRKSRTCKDCSAEINRYNKNSRCYECWNKHRVGKKENPKTITSTCCKCGAEFLYYSGAYRGVSKKYCSRKCYSETRVEKATKKCSECGKEYFKGKVTRVSTVCSKECYAKRRSRLYVREKHPHYTHGRQVDQGATAIKKYREKMIEKYGYFFCEHCGVNVSIPRFEVHHIVFRSEKPKHEFLHDHRNLIHICLECHRAFHNGQSGKNLRKPLIEKRCLIELFGDEIIRDKVSFK